MSRDKLLLNISLVLLYVLLFGWRSVQLYLEGGVIINRKTVVREDIKQPGRSPLYLSLLTSVCQESSSPQLAGTCCPGE